MNTSTIPADVSEAQHPAESLRVEIDDEALTINGVRFASCPKPHELSKALGFVAEKHPSFGHGTDWSFYIWQELGIAGWTQDHVITEVQIWFGEHRPKMNIGGENTETDEQRRLEIRGFFRGKITLWDSSLSSTSRMAEVQRFKPGLPTRKLDLWKDRSIYCSSYGEGIYGTSLSGGVSIGVDVVDDVPQGVRFAWPSLGMVRRAKNLLPILAGEQVILLCETYDYMAPEWFDPFTRWFYMSFLRNRNERLGLADQPILCLTNRRLFARDSEGNVKQWPLCNVSGATGPIDCVPETLERKFPIKATRGERAADAYYGKKTEYCDTDYVCREAQVVVVNFTDEQPSAFVYRCTKPGDYTSLHLADFVAQLASAIARYGSEPPLDIAEPTSHIQNGAGLRGKAPESANERNGSTSRSNPLRMPTAWDIVKTAFLWKTSSAATGVFWKVMPRLLGLALMLLILFWLYSKVTS